MRTRYDGRKNLIRSSHAGDMWKRLKEYINSRKIGSTITRQEIIKVIFNGDKARKYSGYSTTHDVYRRRLTIIGVLEHTGKGEYKVVAHMKESLTSSELAKLACTDRYRQWFHDALVFD